MTDAPFLRARGLTKEFRVTERRPGIAGGLRDLVAPVRRAVVAVDRLDVAIPRGASVGLIGPNGAGKSTTVKMLTGILTPTRGELEVGGLVPYRDRTRYTRTIGAVFGQRSQLWWDLPPLETYRLLRVIYGIPSGEFEGRLSFLSGLMDADGFLRVPARKLSLGQRMRADLIAAFLHEPQVVFLDEPTIGLDVVAKDRMREFLARIHRERGTTILLTTHDLADIERLCPRVLVIDRGCLVMDGPLGALRAKVQGTRVLRVAFHEPVDLAALGADPVLGAATWSAEGPAVATGILRTQGADPAGVVRALVNRFPVADLQIGEPPIEEVVKQFYGERAS